MELSDACGHDLAQYPSCPVAPVGARPPESHRRRRCPLPVAARSGYRSAPFLVEDFRLIRSWLGPAGSTYAELALYPLG